MNISTLTSKLTFLTIACLLSSCSISYSLGKSSDSISASSDSISDSSSSDDNKAAAPTANTYAADVEVATTLYVSTQKDKTQFLDTISNIAQTHGIVDWEQESITYTAMGKGLKQAGIEQQHIASLPYFNNLINSSNYSLILESYH